MTNGEKKILGMLKEPEKKSPDGGPPGDKGKKKEAVKESQEHDVFTPFGGLSIPKKFLNPEMYYYLAPEDSPEFQTALYNGYVVDHDVSAKMKLTYKEIVDGSQIDTTTRIRGHVLLKIPKEKREVQYHQRQAGVVTAEKIMGQYKEATKGYGGAYRGPLAR